MPDYFHVKPHFGAHIIEHMSASIWMERARLGSKEKSPYQQGFSVHLDLIFGSTEAGIFRSSAWEEQTVFSTRPVRHYSFTSKEEAMLHLHGAPGQFHFYIAARRVILAPWLFTFVPGPVIMLQERPDALRWIDFDAPETWKYSQVCM